MEATSDYLDSNEDFKKLISDTSDNTGNKYMDLWLKHLRENRELFKKRGWASDWLQAKEQGKTAIIMGSAPSLAKQIDTLKDVQDDSEFVLCGISSNLGYLLNNGISPKYTVTVDALKSTGDDWNNVDMDKAKDVTLIANTFAYPPMLKRWKGPLYFIELQTSDKKFERKKRKWYGPANGINAGFPSLMAQYNIMTALAFLILECPVIIFVGHELSFKEESSRYYVDREDFRDNEKKFPHGDLYGNKVYTTMGLLALKYSLEGFLEILSKAGWFFNCTEAGIFGITKRFPDRQVPWIKQLTLKNGIAQAKHIMRTGEPMYAYSKDSSVIVPDMRSKILFG